MLKTIVSIKNISSQLDHKKPQRDFNSLLLTGQGNVLTCQPFTLPLGPYQILGKRTHTHGFVLQSQAKLGHQTGRRKNVVIHWTKTTTTTTTMAAQAGYWFHNLWWPCGVGNLAPIYGIFRSYTMAADTPLSSCGKFYLQIDGLFLGFMASAFDGGNYLWKRKELVSKDLSCRTVRKFVVNCFLNAPKFVLQMFKNTIRQI